MGYHTDFAGSFTVTPPLRPEHAHYLRAFRDTRRMKRQSLLTATLPDQAREAVELPVGVDGGYYVGASEYRGQSRTPDVVQYNEPPSGQPGLWCQWIPNDDGTEIEWDEGEKFYDYVEWLEYLIAHFLGPWGYIVNGEVRWRGESLDDVGAIFVCDNLVRTAKAIIPRPVFE